MFAVMWLGLALGGSVQGDAVAADEVTKGLLRRAQYEQVAISPDGAYLAIAHRENDGTLVTLLDRKTLKAVSQVDPGERAEVQVLDWLGPEQLIISANRVSGDYASPTVMPQLYLLNIHEKHPKLLSSNFVGTIEGDDKHVLVERCKTIDGKCHMELVKLDITHLTGTGESVAISPIEGGTDFLIDHTGQPRFAWAVTEDNEEQLYVRRGEGGWEKVGNDKDAHFFSQPVGVSRDNRYAYLISEKPQGTNVLERYDLGDGSRQVVLSDTRSDPLSIVASLDQIEPIGANFGPGRPVQHFFDPKQTDSQWRIALNAAFPDSMETVVSSTADGNWLVIETTSDRDPGSFYLFDKSTKHAQLLFHGKPWIDASSQRGTDEFSFKARDGLPLTGFLTMPAPGAQLPPMVVMVHGGPYYERDDWSYDRDVQVLAQHGYAVLRVNFRGSSGFGLDFQQRGYRQWGGAMQDDVTDATHWAIDNKLVDGRRVCIFGGSYGGYAALMGAAREPGLYRCAVGEAGVYDLGKMYSWGDTHRYKYGVNYLRRVIGTDKAELAGRSPVAMASSITIPVMLAHGTLDGRVPIEHAKAMRDALVKAGHPPIYLEYPYEGHGLVSQAHLEDFYAHLLRFLDANTGAATAAVASSGATAAKP
ncbi:alpha/beta hydrolase family protein [Luteibacter aegosomatissinici]|uniref:alpha/beta hydrolase family protein n=1 Tax=Luteibacter aegosomatissinici TaxID=2911539 RepID=UPI001FFB2F71|nr:alpha/beta fold hydrolase [Luteibacter aegosomatissinici]UPG95729.1 prolyl oligopeptidase family serine peptidase [Luteibacter aegosomatissinici]